jgi:hypothetical protein
VISCVDTRKARATIAQCAEDWSEVDYWLDLGNNADSGQFVLGEPQNRRNRRHRLRLRTVSELLPEVIQGELDGNGLPSCSAAEAVEWQEPFVNPTLAITRWPCWRDCFATGQSPITGHSSDSRFYLVCRRCGLISSAGRASASTGRENPEPHPDILIMFFVREPPTRFGSWEYS